MSKPIPSSRARSRTAAKARRRGSGSPPAAPGRLSTAARASRDRLARLVERFAGARVLVIGDLMLDRFIRGDVRRISPEAPVPVVQVRGEGVHPGGAGNVAANLAGLGARPAVVGWVGRDAAGGELKRLLDALGADGEGLVVSRDVGTIEKTRVVAHAQQVVRLDREPEGTGERLERALVARVMRMLPRVDAVLVSDYGKGTVTRSLLDRLAERAASGGLLYLIDPKQANFDHYRGATLVKPNAVEAEAASGIRIRDDASLAEAGVRLMERWGTQAVLISRGEQGMSLCRRGRAPRHLPTTAREVFDVTGAGDTVMSVAALALASGGSLEEAAWLANLAAGVVVGKVGTASLTRAELVHAMDLALLEGMGPPAAEPTGRGGRGRTR